MPEMVAPRALVFRPLVKGNEALGTRLDCVTNESSLALKGCHVPLTAFYEPVKALVITTVLYSGESQSPIQQIKIETYLKNHQSHFLSFWRLIFFFFMATIYTIKGRQNFEKVSLERCFQVLSLLAVKVLNRTEACVYF